MVVGPDFKPVSVPELLGTALTLTFDQGQVHGSSGCNTYRAAYCTLRIEQEAVHSVPPDAPRKKPAEAGFLKQSEYLVQRLA